MADNIDILLDQVEGVPSQQELPQDNKMKERLIHVVASGKSKQYLGKLYSTDDIEKLDEKELAKLYARYEAVLGGHITQTLKQHMIYAYARSVEALCPAVSQGRFAVDNTQGMYQSLSNGPFIDLALTSLTCRLYHEYGHLLAPLEAVLLTSSHVRSTNQQVVQPESQPADQQNSATYAGNQPADQVMF